MKKILLLTCLLSTPAMADSITDAMTAAYKNNPDLKAKREELKATDELKNQAVSGWRPTLKYNFRADYSHFEPDGLPDEEGDALTHSLTLSQPVFDGWRTVKSSKRADKIIESGRANLVSKEQDILLSAAEAYINVARFKDELDLVQKNANILGELLSATREKFKVGEVTRTDVSQSKARYERALSDVSIAKGNLISAMATYERITGIEPKNIRMPNDRPKIPPFRNMAIDRAFNNNPVINEQKYAVEASEEYIGVVKSRLFPSVSVVGEANQIDGGTAYSNSDIDYETAYVNVSVPLYQSGSVYSQTRQAKKTLQQQKMALENLHNRVKESVVRVWEQIEVSTETIRTTESAIKALEEALEGTRQEARYGTRTTLDILDAERELFLVKRTLIQTKAEEIAAAYQLYTLMGGLTAESLGLDVEIYDPKEHYDDVKYKLIGF